LTTWPGAMTRIELLDRYRELTGREVADPVFYYVFALFKLAVIVQQIYYRYAQGLTRDARFATMIEMVRALGKKAVASIEAEKISNA